jgi:hypothetical protein
MEEPRLGGESGRLADSRAVQPEKALFLLPPPHAYSRYNDIPRRLSQNFSFGKASTNNSYFLLLLCIKNNTFL